MFYDDGSLHKRNQFYNLNTQSFSREIQEDLILPHLEKFGVCGKCLIERKKTGEEYWYIYVPRFKGSFEIANILQKYKVSCFEYKMWSSETIQKWSKVQMYLKSQDRTITPRLMGDYMKKDIVL